MRLQDIKVGDKFRSNRNGRVVVVTMNDLSPIRPILIDGEGWWTFSSFYNEFTRIDQPLSSRVAELEAELAALKAEKAKPAYDYTNPHRGDLFQHTDGSLYMAVDTSPAGNKFFTLVAIAGNYGAGGRWDLNKCFSGNEAKFTFLGNVNNNPNLLKESLP
jgi:hypothetical protein